MAVAILDTSVDIDHWERGLYQDTLENLRRAYILPPFQQLSYQSSAAAHRRRDAELLVASLFELATVRWEPSAADWWEAGLFVTSKAGT